MALDLFPQENVDRINRLTPATTPEAGAFEGFVRGTGMLTMRGLVKAGGAVDLLGSIGPIAEDAFTDGTVAQERYFREHDELYGKAAEYWTPKSNEVGVAAEIAGSLLSTLPLAILSPGLAVGTTQLSVAEDLVKKGVDATKAQAVGATQALGLGLGIYMPIIGQTLTQRLLVGGMGSNVVQGIAMRGVGEAVLKDTPAAGDYRSFDPTQVTLDALLGLAFGGFVHLSPTQRAHSAEAWQKISDWAMAMKPSERDALMVLRQAQHMNSDSMPGNPVDPIDVERHVQRMRQALDQAVRDKPVEVSDLEPANFTPDAKRFHEMEANVKTMATLAEEVRVAEGLAPLDQAAMGSGTGRPSQTSATLPPPGTHDLPLKDSTRPEPSGNSTIRSSTPSLSTGPLTTLLDDIGTTSKPIISQPGNSPERLLALAIQAKPDLENTLKSAAGEGATVLGVRSKEQARLQEKLASRPADRVSDYLGGRISVDSPGDVVKVLNRIRESHEIVHVDNFLDAPRNGGYRALHIGVKMENGIVAEVQILPKPVAGIIGESHDVYKKWRNVTETMSAAQMKEKAAEEARMSGAFDEAYTKWLKESEANASAAKRGDAAPPPRSKSEAEAAGAEVTPLQREAERFAAENPNLSLHIGNNADGSPISVSVKQYLEDARASAADARADAPLFSIAADCLLRGNG